MAREAVFPQILDTHVTTLRREIDGAYFSSMTDPSEVMIQPRLRRSLERFVQLRSGSWIQEYMKSFQKKEAKENSYIFSVSFVGKNGKPEEDEQSRFVMDTDQGLALGIRDDSGEKTIWIGVVGILYTKDTEKNDSRGLYRGYPRNHPIIAQIQGASTYSYSADEYKQEKPRKAKEALIQYKWERSLVGLVLEWANEEKLPAVYLLPSYKNHWYREGRKDAFHLRYDVSAQRIGFRMQPNGLYGISLLGMEPSQNGTGKSPNLSNCLGSDGGSKFFSA